MKIEFEEWCRKNEDELYIKFAETGMDRELDFNVENEMEKEYEKKWRYKYYFKYWNKLVGWTFRGGRRCHEWTGKLVSWKVEHWLKF